MNRVIVALLLFLDVKSALGYGNGAPLFVCETLVPQHGAEAQKKPSPYSILVSKSSYDDGSLNVTIAADRSDSGFAGFVLQARFHSDSSNIVDGKFGNFDASRAQAIKCKTQTANTLTHRNRKLKRHISALWTPPDTFRAGQVFFVATVVRSKFVFWVNQHSEPVVVEGDWEVATNRPPVYGWTTQKSVTTSRSTASSRAAAQLEDRYTPCGSGKLCFGLPHDCVTKGKDCRILLRTQPGVDGSVIFELYGKPSTDERWFAVGLSRDDLMGEDSVSECILLPDQSVKQLQSWNTRGDRNNEYVTVAGVRPQVSKYEDGQVYCKWERKARTMVRNQEFDISREKFHLLLAKGPFVPGSATKSYHSEKLASVASEDLQSAGVIEGVDSPSPALIKLHGSLMVIAWVGCVSIAIMTARHYKQVWAEQTVWGTNIWFACHRTLMLISVLCVIMGMTSIVLFKKGKWSGNEPHPILGTTACVFMGLQLIGAALRCEPAGENRWIFNWVHWFGGNAAHVSAIAAIFCATFYDAAELHGSFVWVLVGYVISHICVHLIMQMHSCQSTSHKTQDLPMNDMNQEGPNDAKKSTKDPPGNGFKQFMLGLYVVVISTFTLVLLLLVVT